MKRALLVRAGFENELVGDFLRESGVYVGWKLLGDLTGMNSNQVDDLLLRIYPECRTALGAPRKHYREIVDFALAAQTGDIVVTPHRSERRLLIGTIKAPYRFDDTSRLRSGGEPYRHMLPVEWTHAVHRDDVPEAALRDTDQRGKTAFWLRAGTVDALLVAPRRPIVGR